MKITQGKEQLFQGGTVQMKPNHSAWLGAVSNNHPSLPELPTGICGIYVQMLCPSSSCKQARLIFWLKKGIHPGSQQTPRPWAKRCKGKLKISADRRIEDYRVKRQLRKKHLYQPLHALPLTKTARLSLSLRIKWPVQG